jgi:bifunctional ADP-heptose synthase (sugar kinase/adenylyltransferase)
VKAAFPGQDLPVDEDTALRAGAVLRARTGRDLFLTRSESGIMVFTRDSHVSVRGLRVDGPIDPTGAGDSVTAASVLSLASGARPEEAALIANLVGSIVVQQIGVTGAARVEQLGARLDTWLSQPSS